MPKTLVTGGSGFLGSHLVEALVARREDVRVLVRPTSNIGILKNLPVELAYGNLSEISSLRKAVKNVAVIYHCAALAKDWGSWKRFRSVNVTGVHYLLKTVLESNIKKFIHVSTTDVYGYPDYPADETTPYRPRGLPYCDTKIEGEKLVWDYYHQYHLPVTIIRPVNIYGPRSVSFVSDIVKLLRKGSMVHIGNSGKPAGLVYVKNVVDAMLRAADNQQSTGQVYNISDGSDVTWQQYVNRLAKMIGVSRPKTVIPYRLAYLTGWFMEKFFDIFSIDGKPLLTRMAAELFGTNQGFPIKKARQELGYQPRVDFEAGMHQVKIWLGEVGLL